MWEEADLLGQGDAAEYGECGGDCGHRSEGEWREEAGLVVCDGIHE